MFPDAIVDLSLDVEGSRANARLDVPEGSYTVLVRGKGTDPVTMRTNVFIATACATNAIASGETREVRLTLLPIVGMGVCGDDVLSPDEQCDDGNTADGDGCSASCRTERFQVNTTTDGVQNHPAVAGGRGQRWSIAYDSVNTTFLFRTLAPDGSTITSPSVLAMDADIDDLLRDVALGSQLLPDVAVASDGRVGIAFVDFNAGPNIRVGLFDAMRLPQNGGNSILVYNGSSGAPGGAPAVAFAGDGTLMVVYQDGSSATGLSGATFAPGVFTPAPFPIGAGLSGATAPAIAGTADGFVVAMSAGGDVHFQRFGADGAARDAAAVVVSNATGTQDQVAVGALRSGEFLVAWRDELIDGSGSGIGARAFAADGSPRQDPFQLNTDAAGAQSAPAVTAGESTFAVAFVGTSGIRGRYVSSGGAPLPNREAPPTTAELSLGAGAEVALASGGTDTRPVFMAVTEDGGEIYARFFPF
ncbi:MAG: hypothetical protein KF729_17935 [Sandaracinaceae bacterium]|nr:hypothetical protein [Sandaracinaceae bacterium]